MNSFVIHEHQTPDGVHWDFMLRQGHRLLTWRLPVGPEEIGKQGIEAEMTFDHPIRFLTYEGPVQNKTGSIQIVDRGTYSLLKRDGSHFLMQLDGGILKGRFRLIHHSLNDWILRRVVE
jgi:bifunctional non-homologous end joining protein LigD